MNGRLSCTLSACPPVLRDLPTSMNADVRGKIGTAIVPTLDRLSRDVRLAENLFYEFERLGVQILILAERGQSSSGIARVLTEKGLERRNGKPWTQRQVTAILRRDQFYRDGVIRYGQACGQNKSLALFEGQGPAI